MSKQQPWNPADATLELRNRGASGHLDICYSWHARDQMRERSLIIGDVLYLLRNGFVYDKPESATQPKLWKYAMESRTPNSGNRVVRVVVIPAMTRCWVKIVTVMWADEVTCGGRG